MWARIAPERWRLSPPKKKILQRLRRFYRKDESGAQKREPLKVSDQSINEVRQSKSIL